MREPQWARSVWSQTNSIYWHSMGGGLWCILCNALGRAKHDVLKGPWFFFLMQPDSAQETKRERADDAGCQRFTSFKPGKEKNDGLLWRAHVARTVMPDTKNLSQVRRYSRASRCLRRLDFYVESGDIVERIAGSLMYHPAVTNIHFVSKTR